MGNKLLTTGLLACIALLTACSSSKKGSGKANALTQLLADTAIANAHAGILVQEADNDRIIYTLNADKYFVPASNTKLWTMYAALKHLGDSIIGGYVFEGEDKAVILQSAADPTFLHQDYAYQPLANILQHAKTVSWLNPDMATTNYGNGWSWNDYLSTYMAPRSSMPMFGNSITFSNESVGITVFPKAASVFLHQGFIPKTDSGISVFRSFETPDFTVDYGRNKSVKTTLFPAADAMLKLASAHFGNEWLHPEVTILPALKPVYSQPLDSMLKPLMHRSDNFFAEQTLLMISQQWFGKMDEQLVIDSLMKSDLKGMPQPGRWVDGSGLSRYNLFTPGDYVWLLKTMRKQFSMERLQTILPTGNDGTLTNYYVPLENKLFGKTGTLSGVVSLSGYLYAKSGKLLLFSTLINNHNQSSSSAVRRAVEHFLMDVYESN